MRRRDFLRLQAAAACCLAAGSSLLPLHPLFAQSPADALPDLAVAKGAPAAATRAAVELLGGMRAIVSPGQKVLIKPNMSFANPPEMATTTHPEVVRELAAMCKEAGAADILIMDHPLRSPEACLERSGIRDACRDLDSRMVQAVNAPAFFADADIPAGKEMRGNAFLKAVLDADVLIAAPVAKSHGSTGVSLSLKGMMGLIWDRGSMHSRYNLDEAIVDLYTRLTPALTVVDATRVLTTNGPFGPGKVITPQTIIASRDGVAADALAVASFEWWGRRMQPNQVRHLRLAAERGLGRIDIEHLRVQEVVL
ncbi:MAG: DUF362 domain-containing protein [Desulfovibrio sp.]|nr:DUF362 domain-containing protein [Desulfovibrio sp.]